MWSIFMAVWHFPMTVCKIISFRRCCFLFHDRYPHRNSTDDSTATVVVVVVAVVVAIVEEEAFMVDCCLLFNLLV